MKKLIIISVFSMVSFILGTIDYSTAQSKGDIVCYFESRVATGYTYYDCGSCEKVIDEKGKGSPSKCKAN